MKAGEGLDALASTVHQGPSTPGPSVSYYHNSPNSGRIKVKVVIWHRIVSNTAATAAIRTVIYSTTIASNYCLHWHQRYKQRRHNNTAALGGIGLFCQLHISSFVPVRGKPLAEWMVFMDEMGHDVSTPPLGIQGTAGWVTNASQLISQMISFQSSSRPTISSILNSVGQLQGMCNQNIWGFFQLTFEKW